MEEIEIKIREIDIAELIRQQGKHDFLIFVQLDFRTADSHARFVTRNGIVIILCKGNGGSMMIDRKVYDLSGNSVLILPENHIVSLDKATFTGECSTIMVSVDHILNMPSPIDTDIFSYSRYVPSIKVTDSKYDDLMSYYRFLYKESLEESRYQSEIIRSIFYALILEITAEYENNFNSKVSGNIKADNLSDRFFRLLAMNYKKHRCVKYYADKLNLTPKYLSSAVKRATGRPILEWIHEAILIDAKMLLRTTDMTVQEISDLLNFSSASAFVQFIKKHTGTTPKKL